MKQPLHLFTFALLAFAGVAPAFAQGTPSATSPPAGTASVKAASPERTRAEFEAVCRRFTEGDNQYFGRTQLEHLEALLAERKRLDNPEEPFDGARLRLALAQQQLRLGLSAEAATILGEVQALDGIDEKTRLLALEAEAFANLQLAEALNCVKDHSAESCILPIVDGGVHRNTEPARRAAELFDQVVKAKDDPAESVQPRWLRHIAQRVAGGEQKELGGAPQATDFPRWTNIAPDLGIGAVDLSGGGIMDDFDGDGLLDLISSTWDPCGSLKAFRNDGRGGFEDTTVAWGLDSQLGGLNLIHADVDGDGALDLFVLRGAWLGDDGRVRNSLLKNDLQGASGKFLDITTAAGLAYPSYPTQAGAWADYDGDGDLDLYVGNESKAQNPSFSQLLRRPLAANPSQLFQNRGNGRFVNVSRQAGVMNLAFAKGVTWGDYDNDGDPDLFVSNIGPNRLYRNNGNGTFTDVAQAMGVADHPNISFATWFFDHDNDGDLDLWINDYGTAYQEVSSSYLGDPVEQPRTGNPVLYRNDGGKFVDVSNQIGLDRPALPMGSNFGDLDNDGWLDVYLGTGVPDFDALMPNVMYRNRGDGSFSDVTFAGGFGHLQKGHGVAFGDLDNDGDQDIFQQMGGSYPFDAYANALYENPGNGAETAWITLRLVARQANRSAIGARVEVRVPQADGSFRSIHRLVGSGGSFGGNSLQVEIGLGDLSKPEIASIEALDVIVRWPGRREAQRFPGIAPNHVYRLTEGTPEPERLTLPRFPLGASADPSAGHHHASSSSEVE